MGKTYAVQVTTVDAFGEPELVDRTVVYADSELEARTNGAVILGVPDYQVDVVDLDADTPTDAQMEAIQSEARAATLEAPDWMRNIHQQ